MSELFAAVVSIAPTKRRRFLWAAWWTASPSRTPTFQKPDASEGGARTREEALRQAERVAGRPLVEVEGLWARAWARVLMGQPPFPASKKVADEAASPPRPARREVPEGSIWAILGVTPQATLAEIRAAFRERTLATHPDRGGDAEAFRQVQRAFKEAQRRIARRRPARARAR